MGKPKARKKKEADESLRAQMEEARPVRQVVARRRDGSVWKMAFSRAVEASDLLDERALLAAEVDRGTVELEVSDGDLFALTASALGLGATVTQSDRPKKKAKCVERVSLVVKLGHELERVLSFVTRSDLGVLCRLDASSKAPVLASVCELRLEASAHTVVRDLLPAPHRLKALDLTAYAVFSTTPAEAFAACCPRLESLTLRQDYQSPRKKDRTTVFDLHGVKCVGYRANRTLREDFARSYFRDLLAAFPGLVRLNLVLENADWFQTGEEDAPLTPNLEILTLATTVERQATSWRDERHTKLRLSLGQLQWLVRGSKLRCVAVAEEVNVPKEFWSLAQVEAYDAPRLLCSRELMGGGYRTHFSAVEALDIARRVASEVSALTPAFSSLAALKTTIKTVSAVRFRENTNGSGAYHFQYNQESDRPAIERASDQLKTAVADLGNLVGNAPLTALDVTFDSRDGRQGTYYYESSPEDFLWPDLSDALRQSGLRDLRLDGNEQAPRQLALWLDKSEIFTAHTPSRLERLVVDDVTFDASRALTITAPLTLKSVSFSNAANVERLTFKELPRLGSIRCVTTNPSYRWTPRDPSNMEAIIIQDCPRLATLVIDANALSGKPSINKKLSQAVVLEGPFPDLKNVHVFRAKKKHADGPAAACTVLEEFLCYMSDAQNDYLDKACADWHARLVEASASPADLFDLATQWDEEPAEGEEDDKASNNPVRDLQQQLLTTADCVLYVGDADLSKACPSTWDVDQVALRVVGHLPWCFSQFALDLVLDELDEDAASRVVDALNAMSADFKALRRLAIANFSTKHPFAPPASLRRLALAPAHGTKTLDIDASRCAPSLRVLALGGSSLAKVTVSQPLLACDDLKLETPKLRMQCLNDLLANAPVLDSLTLVKMKALDKALTIANATVRTVVLDSCPTVSVALEGKSIQEVHLARLYSMTTVGLFAPFVRKLTFTSCSKLHDAAIDVARSSTFHSLQHVAVKTAWLVTTKFFQPFATSKNRRNLHLTMQGCDPTYKPKGAITKSVIDVTKTDDWLTFRVNNSNNTVNGQAAPAVA